MDRELVNYIIDNELYDILIYSNNGEDLNDIDLNHLKRYDFAIIETECDIVYNDVNRYNYLWQDDEKYIVYMLNVYNKIIELYIYEDLHKRLKRELKINSIINE